MERILIDKSNLHLFAGMLNSTVEKKILEEQEIGIGIVANTDDGEAIPAGALSFYLDEPFVRISWVYVLPQWRGTGFGSELLRTAIEGFLYDDESNLSSVLAAYTQDAQLDALFTACGFDLLVQEGATYGHTTLADGLVVPLTNGRESTRVMTLSQLEPEWITSLLQHNPTMGGVLEPEPARWVDRYLPASHAYVSKGVIMGLLLFTVRGQDLYLEYAYSQKPETMALPYLIESARKVLAAEYPPETPLCLATTNPTTAAIATKLLGDLKTAAVCIAELDLLKLQDAVAGYDNIDGRIE